MSDWNEGLLDWGKAVFSRVWEPCWMGIPSPARGLETTAVQESF